MTVIGDMYWRGFHMSGVGNNMSGGGNTSGRDMTCLGGQLGVMIFCGSDVVMWFSSTG